MGAEHTKHIVHIQAGGYGKVITHVIIGLKTVKGTKQLKLDPTIYDSLQKEKVLPGDVIYIEANSGKLCQFVTAQPQVCNQLRLLRQYIQMKIVVASYMQAGSKCHVSPMLYLKHLHVCFQARKQHVQSDEPQLAPYPRL